MGCITKHYLNKDTVIGVWKIQEDLPELFSMVEMSPEDKKRYAVFRSTSRKLEFLSVRALLAELLGNDAKIVYNKNNKPFIKDGSHFISISHSHKLTAILISRNERVGIDLEYMRANINAFASKFINKKESLVVDALDGLLRASGGANALYSGPLAEAIVAKAAQSVGDDAAKTPITPA